MFNVRNGMYETNSSSCHSFIVPKDSEHNIKIPSNIKLFGNDDTTNQIGRIRYMYQKAYEGGYGQEFIDYLKSKGIIIEEESYDESKTEAFCNYLGITLKDLDNICFNDTLIDECDSDTYSDKENDYENYIHIDIS